MRWKMPQLKLGVGFVVNAYIEKTSFLCTSSFKFDVCNSTSVTVVSWTQGCVPSRFWKLARRDKLILFYTWRLAFGAAATFFWPFNGFLMVSLFNILLDNPWRKCFGKVLICSIPIVSDLFPWQIMTLRNGDENGGESMDVNIDIPDDQDDGEDGTEMLSPFLVECNSCSETIYWRRDGERAAMRVTRRKEAREKSEGKRVWRNWHLFKHPAIAEDLY